jgi:hypothetical protein
LYFVSRHALEMIEQLRKKYLARFDQASAAYGNAQGVRA